MSKKFLTTKEAAIFLTERGYSVTPKTLEVFRCYRRGPGFIKIGHRVFYRRDQLDDFLKGVEVKVFNPKTGKFTKEQVVDPAEQALRPIKC